MKSSAAIPLVVAGYLYLNLFLLPGAPILLNGDQVFFWMDGQRILAGELPYRDFFQFTAPGTDLFYWATFKIFGTRIWVLNGVVLLLGVVLSCIGFSVAARIMDRKQAVLATFLFATLIYSKVLSATHHWFSVLAIMIAIGVLLPGLSAARLAVAGALLGIASFFTQTHGFVSLVGISLFLRKSTDPNQSWRRFWKNERLLLIGFAVTFLSLNAYFLATVGVEQLLYYQGFYVLRAKVSRPETALLGMPDYRASHLPLLSLVYDYIQYLAVYTLVPAAYFFVCWRAWRRPYELACRQPAIALLAVVGAFLWIEQIFSLNWLRLYTVSLPGILLFTWLVGMKSRARRYVLSAMWLVVIGTAVQRVWITQHHDYAAIQLPAGQCVIEGPEYEEMTWLMQHTVPGESVFDANWPGLYVPLGLRNPVFLDTANTMLNPVWAERAVQALEMRRVHYVLWAAKLDYPVDPHHPSTGHIVPLRNYVHTRYRYTKTFVNGEELWERK